MCFVRTRRRFVKVVSTSDSVRSIRLLFSSVRFSEDLFSSSPSPSSLNTLTSSVLPRSSPPLDETCGMVYSQGSITARCYMALAQMPIIFITHAQTHHRKRNIHHVIWNRRRAARVCGWYTTTMKRSARTSSVSTVTYKLHCGPRRSKAVYSSVVVPTNHRLLWSAEAASQ